MRACVVRSLAVALALVALLGVGCVPPVPLATGAHPGGPTVVAPAPRDSVRVEPQRREAAWPFGKIIFVLWLSAIALSVAVQWAKKLLARRSRLVAAFWQRLAGWRPVPPGYDVPCSMCGTRRMQVARTLVLIRGRGLFTAWEHCTLAGCPECVMREGLRAAGRTLRDGLWSVGGIFAAPGAAVMDLLRLFGPSDTTLADRLIREAGLDPNAVRLDEDGYTRVERMELNVTAAACARLVWADRRCAPKAHAIALQYLTKITAGRLMPVALARFLLDPGTLPMAPRALDPLARSPLYRLFKQLATADGPASPRMYEVIREVMAKLGFASNEISDLMRDVVLASRTEEAKRADARARAQAHANAGASANAGAGASGSTRSGGAGSSQRGPNPGTGPGGGAGTGQDRGARPPRAGRDDLVRARAVLGVSANASWPEILAAFRASIAIWHPDRAGFDPKRQREFTLRTQELTWAKDALRRAASIAWTS